MSTKGSKSKKDNQITDPEDQASLKYADNINQAEEGILKILHELQARQVEVEMQKAELSRIREELQQTRDKYIALYNFSPAGYLTLDNQGVILEINPTLCKLLDIDKQRLVGSNLSKYVSAESRGTLTSHIKDVLATGVRRECEISIQKKDGSPLFLKLESIALRDSQGQLTQCYTAVTDITLSKNLESWNKASDLSQAAILATDKDLNIISWNKAAETIFGWQSKEVLGKPASLLVHTGILDFLNKNDVLKFLSDNGFWIGNIVVHKKDGVKSNKAVSLGILWNNEGQFNGVIAIYHDSSTPGAPQSNLPKEDIENAVKKRTEELEKANRILQQELNIHKQAAVLAKESEGKNRDLVDNIKLGIFRCTPGLNGKFLEVNKAMEEITGYTRDELLQMDVCSLFFDNQSMEPFTNEVNITDWKVIRELNLRQKNGNIITTAESIVAIRFDSGITQYFDGILEDITERKQAQLQVQQSLQRLQKTIKEIIQAMAYIGQVRDPYTAGHQRRVAQISFEIAKMMNLTEDQYEG